MFVPTVSVMGIGKLPNVILDDDRNSVFGADSAFEGSDLDEVELPKYVADPASFYTEGSIDPCAASLASPGLLEDNSIYKEKIRRARVQSELTYLVR